jgi:hypothetical protein
LREFGLENGRPDQCGVLLSINQINGGIWVFAIELKKDAIKNDGEEMMINIAENISLPIIVVNYDSMPPDDKGDRVILHDTLLSRAKHLVGDKLGQLAHNINIYKLVVN